MYRLVRLRRSFVPYSACVVRDDVYVVGTLGEKRGVVYKTRRGAEEVVEGWLVDCLYDGAVHAVGNVYYRDGVVEALDFGAYWVVKWGSNLYMGGWERRGGDYAWRISRGRERVAVEFWGTTWSADAESAGIWAVGDAGGRSIAAFIQDLHVVKAHRLKSLLLSSVCASANGVYMGGSEGVYKLSGGAARLLAKTSPVAKILCADRVYAFAADGTVYIFDDDTLSASFKTGVEFKIGRAASDGYAVYAAGIIDGEAVLVEIPVKERVELLPMEDATRVR